MTNHSAHLCLVLDPSQEGPPRITGAGIFNAGPMRLTQSNGRQFAELCVMHGDSFQQARDMLLEYLEHPSKAWVRVLMPARDDTDTDIVETL